MPLDWLIAGLLAAGALWLRRTGLAPSSLWLDDAWVAAAAARSDWRDVFSNSLAAPGFTALLRPMIHAGGDASLAAQLLPLAAGIAGPALLYLAMVDRRVQRALALAAALVLAGSTNHARYSVFVKQYTVEAVLSIVLIWCAWTILDDGVSRRRWLRLLLVACASFVISAPIAPVIAAAVGVAGWRAWGSRRDGLYMAASTAGAAAFALVWWYGVVAPNLNDLLHDFWASYYVVTDSGLQVALDSVYERSRAVLAGLSAAAPTGALVVFLVAAGVVLWRRPAIGLLLCGPVVLAVALAVTEVAPLGTGRTDIYLYPLLIMQVGVAVDSVAGGLPTRPAAWVAGVVLVVATASLVALDSPRYVGEDIRPLVAELEARRSPGDAILVYPLANFAFGLYTTYPVEIVPSAQYATGWEIEVQEPDVTVLPDHRANPARYQPIVLSATQGIERVWLIGSHLGPDIIALEEMLAAQGFAVQDRVDRVGAVLEMWTRPRASDGQPGGV